MSAPECPQDQGFHTMKNDSTLRSPNSIIINMSSLQLAFPLDLDLITQSRSPILLIIHNIANIRRRLPQHRLCHRLSRLPESRHRNSHIVPSRQDMSADEQAVCEEIPAFAFDGGLNDDGETEADSMEEHRQRNRRAEAVDEEGYGAVIYAECYETRWFC